ncbi:propanoyl-CoA acyltransferase [Aliikangiella marina]|uniref:Propanoyl-CoA acyltransferase n=1 Tax=Aliikangiella marina TaxID=1712262 RepID=A0A545T8W9_9GAMM|nr:beta-ketoacyl synthase N-terminal-like domain-containing protein [Aliikangiella marina]TQV73635.1 propanoyl-CoA acyltransferase [Aliikangiella marina]
MNHSVYIRNSYHTPFKMLPEETLYSLYAKALIEVIETSEFSIDDVDAVFVANYSGGSFNQQEHIAPYAVNIGPRLRGKPMYRVEAACASGASAVDLANMAIYSGKIDTAVVIGIEKMTQLDTSGVTSALAKASYFPSEGGMGFSFPALFSEYAKGWLKHYQFSNEQLQYWLALISSKAYSLGAQNPLAQLRTERTVEELLALPDNKNPEIASPLRLHDCSPISDGAAAIILSRHQPIEKRVRLADIETCCDYLNIIESKKPNHQLEVATQAIDTILSRNKLSINNIQFAEIHDCFTISELLMYSALGIAKPGREFQALESGDVLPGGKCVVNPSGGLKSKGHPVGATGVSMHVLAYRQLINEASGYQVENAENAIIVNLGGSAATNVVSLISREE